MKETHVELCCCGAWFATDTFALKARAEEVAAFREAHKVCRERHVKGIPSKPPAGDRTAAAFTASQTSPPTVTIGAMTPYTDRQQADHYNADKPAKKQTSATKSTSTKAKTSSSK